MKKNKIILVISITSLVLIILSVVYVITQKNKETNDIISFEYYTGSSGYAIEFKGNKNKDYFEVDFKEYDGGQQNQKNFTIKAEEFTDLLNKTNINDCKKHTYEYQCGENDGCSHSSFSIIFENNNKICYEINSNISTFFDNLSEIYKDVNIQFDDYDLNHNELNEDIESIKKSGIIKNAKLLSNETNVNPTTYQGDGYVIYQFDGGEVVEYEIYSNEQLIWQHSIYYPQTIE